MYKTVTVRVTRRWVQWPTRVRTYVRTRACPAHAYQGLVTVHGQRPHAHGSRAAHAWRGSGRSIRIITIRVFTLAMSWLAWSYPERPPQALLTAPLLVFFLHSHALAHGLFIDTTMLGGRGQPKGWVLLCGHGVADGAGGCSCALNATGTEQSLDEMQFERSACGAAQDGDVAKLRRILQRDPAAAHRSQGVLPDEERLQRNDLRVHGAAWQPRVMHSKATAYSVCLFNGICPPPLRRRLHATALCLPRRPPGGSAAAAEKR